MRENMRKRKQWKKEEQKKRREKEGQEEFECPNSSIQCLKFYLIIIFSSTRDRKNKTKTRKEKKGGKVDEERNEKNESKKN